MFTTRIIKPLAISLLVVGVTWQAVNYLKCNAHIFTPICTDSGGNFWVVIYPSPDHPKTQPVKELTTAEFYSIPVSTCVALLGLALLYWHLRYLRRKKQLKAISDNKADAGDGK